MQNPQMNQMMGGARPQGMMKSVASLLPYLVLSVTAIPDALLSSFLPPSAVLSTRRSTPVPALP